MLPIGVLFRAEAGVAFGEFACVGGDVIARRGKRIDAARNESGQVCTPGRNQFRFSLPNVGRLGTSSMMSTFRLV